METASHIFVIDSAGLLETARQSFPPPCTVRGCHNEADALTGMRAGLPQLVLLGWIEPRGASHRLAAALAADPATSNIPILVVDVRPDEYPRKGWRWSDGFSPNIKGYIWRPITPQELRTAADGVLQRVRAGTMNLAEVATQTEETLKRIGELKKLLGSGEEE